MLGINSIQRWRFSSSSSSFGTYVFQSLLSFFRLRSRDIRWIYPLSSFSTVCFFLSFSEGEKKNEGGDSDGGREEWKKMNK